MSIPWKNLETKKFLTTKFGEPILKDFGEGYKRLLWKTSYGVSFQELTPDGIDIWICEYDEDLPYLNPKHKYDACSGQDIEKAIKVLEKCPTKLRDVPKEIQILEKYGAKIDRHDSHFGKWKAQSDKFCAFNNPLECSLGHTNSEFQYELQTFHDNKVYQNLEISQVINIVKGI